MIIKAGSAGTEMFMVMNGEVEVLAHGEKLGYLTEGAFFGEAPVLDDFAGAEVRTRTVISVTDFTELCFLTKDSMKKLQIR
eukprot:SAG31_NODE_3852_length_3817_cov_6.007800_3_plen_81_part_00